MFQAFFLDRDGVINRERADYVKSWAEFEFLPGVLPALQRLALLNAPILVISNQSAIGRGLVTSETVNAIHQAAQAKIEAAGGRIDGFFVCPHRPDEACACRKPKPDLLFQAAKLFNLDLGQCVFIGDTLTDFQAAEAAGCQSILVESGRQGPQLRKLCIDKPAARITLNLAAAVDLILSIEQRNHV
ncbi:MAG: HAD family hydrolase [Caldilineaceae bacterium]